MDEGGVATSIASVTQTTLDAGQEDKARGLARDCNDYAAKLVSDYRGRFGMFTALPMPDIDGTLREIEYGMDVLKADGVGMYTSYRDKWLGDPAFDPVFEELDRRKAVIYVHPTVPDCCVNLVPGQQDANIEYGTDTTRAIANMVFSGASQRFSNLRMIWSHAGGTMPFLIERFMRTATFREHRKKLPGGFLPEAQRFFYDTAQASNKVALTAARMVIPLHASSSGPIIPIAARKSTSKDCANPASSTIGSCGTSTAPTSRAFCRNTPIDKQVGAQGRHSPGSGLAARMSGYRGSSVGLPIWILC